MNPFGVQNNLKISRFRTADEAIEAGYDYKAHTPLPTPVEIERVVIVQEGTQEGNPTVDFILRDENGNKYVVMITGRMLKALPL